MLDRLASEAHLWIAELGDAHVRSRLAGYRELLSPEERRRHERFRAGRAAEEYLVGRALARTALSRYAQISPADWELTPTDRGRPEIAGPAGAPPLAFNLAHAEGLVACLIAAGGLAGVDVEHPAREVDVEALARRYFAAGEQQTVLAAQGAERAERFFAVWTLKEAYLKARGLGISVPLASAEFRGWAEGPIQARFAPLLDDLAAAWQFELRRLASGHLAAVALRLDPATPRRLVAFRAAPPDRLHEEPLTPF